MVAWELNPVRWVVATMFATPVGFPLCRRILDTDRQGLGLCKTFRGGTVPRPDSMTITDKLFSSDSGECWKAPDTMHVQKNVIDFDSKHKEIEIDSLFLQSRPDNNGHSFSVP